MLISNFLPSCLYVISWQPEKYRHTKAQRQRKKEKYKTRNRNSITPVCRLSTTTNTVHLLKFKKRHKSIESCSYQTSWVNMSYFQMHDSIHHGMNVSPFHMSKINKTQKILFLKFLGYFTRKTGKRKFKKEPWKNQVATLLLNHLASTEVIKPIPLCCSFPQGAWTSCQYCSMDSYAPGELKVCSVKATVATVT